MTERGSTHHSPRVDDMMSAETESLTRGAPVEARAEEWRQVEAPADGEPAPDARISGEGGAPLPGVLALDEIEARSMLAVSLRPSAFPADRDALLAVAGELHAEPQVVESLESLPSGRVFENVQEVWEALGGHVEQREVPHETPAPPRPRPAATRPTRSAAKPSTEREPDARVGAAAGIRDLPGRLVNAGGRAAATIAGRAFALGSAVPRFVGRRARGLLRR
jgi:hypothetical protein